jgi:hypothetical protein
VVTRGTTFPSQQETATAENSAGGKRRQRETAPLGGRVSRLVREPPAGLADRFPAQTEGPLPGCQAARKNDRAGRNFRPATSAFRNFFLMECRRIFPPVRGIVSLKEGFVLLFSKLVLSLFYTIIDLPFTLTTSPCPKKAQRV